jgi:regulatory protein YycI of two-component signal transduction system YycFG
MDWGRAKSVLILAFLMLNLLLGYQLWTEWRAQVGSSDDWTALSAETQAVMAEKGIRLDAKIPADTPVMRDLSFVLLPPPGGSERMQEPIPLSTQPEARIVFNQDELMAALGRVIPELGNYAYDDPGSRSGVFVLYRMANGFPIFDIRLELYNSEQKIQAYRQDLIQILESEEGQKQQILPASKAVAHLIENYLPHGSVIKDIRLGYHGQIFPDAEKQISAPTWRVLLENGEVYYVHAISAEVTTEKGDAPLVPIQRD